MHKFALLALGLLSAQAHSETVFNYDGFYARMKKSEQPQYSQVTLTFILQKRGTTQSCDIQQAKITTDISDAPLTLASNGELILPYEKLLNDRKALIRLVQSPDAEPCDLNFRIRNKMPLAQTVSLKQLREVHQQFDLLLKDLAGLGKYFLPAMTGITFSVTNATVDSSDAVIQAWRCEQQHCVLDLTALREESDDVELRFSQVPAYLFPYIPR